MKIGYSMTQAELSVKYSRFLRLIVNDNATASGVLQSILDNTDGTNAKIFMQLLDIELHIHPLVAENVVKILDAAVATKAMPSRQKLLFSQRKIEFMEDFGPDISCIQKAKDDHEKLTEDVKKEAKDTEVKSEKAIETIEGHSGKSKVKNGGGDSSTTYSSTGASNSASYAAAHNSNYDQYGSRYNYGNYGQYYQGYSY